MDSPWQRKPWRSEPAAWLCLVFAGVVVISLAVGIGADLALLTRLNRRVCGEWAPPGWKNDPRCDGSLYPLKRRAYTTAKWMAYPFRVRLSIMIPFASGWKRAVAPDHLPDMVRYRHRQMTSYVFNGVILVAGLLWATMSLWQAHVAVSCCGSATLPP